MRDGRGMVGVDLASDHGSRRFAPKIGHWRSAGYGGVLSSILISVLILMNPLIVLGYY